MNEYKVTVTEVETVEYVVYVEAEGPEAAEDTAQDLLMRAVEREELDCYEVSRVCSSTIEAEEEL